jgi:hypothetical protein
MQQADAAGGAVAIREPPGAGAGGVERQPADAQDPPHVHDRLRLAEHEIDEGRIAGDARLGQPPGQRAAADGPLGERPLGGRHAVERHRVEGPPFGIPAGLAERPDEAAGRSGIARRAADPRHGRTEHQTQDDERVQPRHHVGIPPDVPSPAPRTVPPKEGFRIAGPLRARESGAAPGSRWNAVERGLARRPSFPTIPPPPARPRAATQDRS